MNFTITGRAAGKTSKLLALMYENDDLVMITATAHLAEMFEKIFRDRYPMKPNKNRFVHVGGLREFKGRRTRFVIDDVDTILYDLLVRGSGEIVHVTATGVIDPV